MPGDTTPKGISDAKLKAALIKHAGGFSATATELGCTYQNVHNRVSGNPEMEELLAEIERKIVEGARSVVIVAMQERGIGGRPTPHASALARWWLERKGGFNPKAELTGPNGSPLPPAVSITTIYVGEAGDHEKLGDVV